MVPQVLSFLAVLCWGLAPERTTLLALRAAIAMFALGLN